MLARAARGSPAAAARGCARRRPRRRRARTTRARALGQAEQARLHRRRQLAGAERQRGRLVAEGVDDVGAVGPGQAVVQGQERAGLRREFNGDRSVSSADRLRPDFTSRRPAAPWPARPDDAQGHSRRRPAAREAAGPRARRAGRRRAARAAAAHRPAGHGGAAARPGPARRLRRPRPACCTPAPTTCKRVKGLGGRPSAPSSPRCSSWRAARWRSS